MCPFNENRKNYKHIICLSLLTASYNTQLHIQVLHKYTISNYTLPHNIEQQNENGCHGILVIIKFTQFINNIRKCCK